MEITNQLIQNLAQLSKLSYQSPEEIETIQNDLKNMLNFIDQINEIDTQNIEPLIHLSPETNVFRPDQTIQLNNRTQALFNAPQHNNTYIKVPKVIEK